MLLAPYWVETEAHSKIGVLTMLIGFSILAIILIIIWVCIKLFVKDEGRARMKPILFNTEQVRNPFYTGIMDNEPMFCVDSDGLVVYKKPSERMKEGT